MLTYNVATNSFWLIDIKVHTWIVLACCFIVSCVTTLENDGDKSRFSAIKTHDQVIKMASWVVRRSYLVLSRTTCCFYGCIIRRAVSDSLFYWQWSRPHRQQHSGGSGSSAEPTRTCTNMCRSCTKNNFRPTHLGFLLLSNIKSGLNWPKLYVRVNTPI